MGYFFPISDMKHISQICLVEEKPTYSAKTLGKTRGLKPATSWAI